MAINMPPLCRRKKVLDRYNPDTFRVISEFAEETHPKHPEEGNYPSEWRRQWLDNEGLALPDIYNRQTEVLPKAVPDYRINRPHPGNCGFLRNNVRSLNEPICSVYTYVPEDDSKHWWPSRANPGPPNVPPRTNDTVYRGDFQEAENKTAEFGSLRHTANPNKEPALGAVPVNFLRPRDGGQKLFKEKMSYEHLYNSRVDPNYPIRGKRHGSFVWDQMSSEATKNFVDKYRVISAEEGARRQQISEAENLANEAANLLESTQQAISAIPGQGQGQGHGNPNQGQGQSAPDVSSQSLGESIQVNNNNVQEVPPVSSKEENATKSSKASPKQSPTASKKGTPAPSGQNSPKRPGSRKNSSKPCSGKKESSRKSSVSNEQKPVQKDVQNNEVTDNAFDRSS
ncbi:uncharacterized protein LOC128209095 isoform X2 [Mya arenaria]|uniref:uncharacterized protein LOC128209095 isoform X2 n=1 Tax=Mya arenaria TaxID=6604 RepID=UPI0022E0B8B9|nr:uncharacterized protein LOC128209095 isoform X2 [Mya arenaria]